MKDTFASMHNDFLDPELHDGAIPPSAGDPVQSVQAESVTEKAAKAHQGNPGPYKPDPFTRNLDAAYAAGLPEILVKATCLVGDYTVRLAVGDVIRFDCASLMGQDWLRLHHTSDMEQPEGTFLDAMPMDGFTSVDVSIDQIVWAGESPMI